MTDIDRAACVIELVELEQVVACIPHDKREICARPGSHSAWEMADAHLQGAQNQLELAHGKSVRTHLALAKSYLSYLLPEFRNFREPL